MFFVVILIGSICTVVVLLLLLKDHVISAIIGAIISLIGLGVIIANNGWLMLLAFAIGVVASFLITRYFVNKYDSPAQKNQVTYSKKDMLYTNHCWNCGKEIDSRWDKKCYKCGNHYICSNCGKCWCDDPRNRKSIVNNGGLFMSNYSNNIKKSFYFCLRLMEARLEAIKSGTPNSVELVNYFINTKTELYSYLREGKRFTKNNAGDEIDNIIEMMNQFLNSISFNYSGIRYDKESLDTLLLVINMYKNIYFDSTPLEMIQMDAELVSIIESNKR